jgi:sialate O-acetylesterase
LEFDHIGNGLVAAADYLRGFTIAGNDKHFVSAKVEILKDKVVVDIPKELEGQEIAIRYAWKRNPIECNFFNKNGLPASPFRTDSF